MVGGWRERVGLRGGRKQYRHGLVVIQASSLGLGLLRGAWVSARGCSPWQAHHASHWHPGS